ncbi:MAG: phosphocholine cytidylyltransferase family protein [Myxococcota bacterium]
MILAAGFGSRLSGVSSQTTSKPLTPVAGRPLLYRTLDGLLDAGCERIVIVIGFGAEELRSQVETGYDREVELEFVVNPHYQLANGVSLLCAREHVDGDFILTMADHVFDPSILDMAMAYELAPDSACLLVDSKIDQVFDLDDATKVWAEGDTLVEIGKQLTRYNRVDTGCFVCSAALFDEIAAVYDSKGDASLSHGVQALARSGRMKLLDVGDARWQDVDTPEMLAEAEAWLSE